MKPKEQVVCGLAAVQALAARDAAAIQRLYFDPPTGRRLGALCRALAERRRIYRQVAPVELEKVAGTVHHGGVVAVIAPRVLRAPRREELRAWAQARAPLLLLDRIGNAHNLGAIVRTAAFFGVRHLLLPDDPGQARPGEATYRIAEGGMEHVELYVVPALEACIRELREFYLVLGAAARGAGPVGAADGKRPCALVLGNEEHGLSPAVAAACDRLVTIPGSGAVESLNVSAAAAVLCWECYGKRAPASGPSLAGRRGNTGDRQPGGRATAVSVQSAIRTPPAPLNTGPSRRTSPR